MNALQVVKQGADYCPEILAKNEQDKAINQEKGKGVPGRYYMRRDFVAFIQEHGYGIHEGFVPFVSYLAERDLPANTYNAKIAAAKQCIRWMIDEHGHEYSSLQLWQLEQDLKSVKLKKLNENQVAVSHEKCLTPAEVQRLIDVCPDPAIKYMIQFMYRTGCRISEMLNVALVHVEPKRKQWRIRISKAKANKERFVYLDARLAKEVLEYFHGERWLFEHHGKQYNRSATTNRIKQTSILAFGVDEDGKPNRPVTAHMLRHSYATEKYKELGHDLHKLKGLMGHSSVDTTERMYVHAPPTPEESELAL